MNQRESDQYCEMITNFDQMVANLVDERDITSLHVVQETMLGIIDHMNYCLERGVSWRMGQAERGITPPSGDLFGVPWRFEEMFS